MNFLIALSVQCIVMLVFIGTVINFRRFIVSKTAELTLALTDLTAAVNKAVVVIQNGTASSTPDADVSAAISQIQAATQALNQVAP